MAFTAVDEAGNTSLASNVSMQFDNTAPGPVAIKLDGDRDGSSALITWYDYNEAENGGDIKSYHIYVSDAPFTNGANASRLATVSGGQRDYIAKGLIKDRTYYFAVQSEDQQGNTASTMQSLSVVIRDAEAPDNISDLKVQSFAEKLVFSWSPIVNGDASQYKIVANGRELLIDAALSSYELTGLSPATGYSFSIKTLDTNANESDGVSLEAATLLANPENIELEALSGQIRVLWSGSLPTELVKEYAVYISETEFSSVDGLTPRLKVSKNHVAAKVAGLRNQKRYFVAVTTINISDGESKQVNAIEVSPTEDAIGPEIHTVHYNESPIDSGSTLLQSGEFKIQASDASAVSRVEVLIDGESIGKALVNGDGYSFPLALSNYTDGDHQLSIHAYDTLDNRTERLLSLSFALAIPDTPVILTPQDGYTSNESQISVTGTAEKHSSLQIMLSNILSATATTDDTGKFSVLLDLEEGTNLITATAVNRSGSSMPSDSITVTRDTSIPETPLGLIADVKSGGEVRLSWNKSVDSSVVGYDLYRHTSQFTDVLAASKVNTQAITLTAYTDLPAADGLYYYRLVARNKQASVSALSKEVFVETDRTAPHASQINYMHTGNFDSVSNHMGTGYVDVEVIVTEPLLTAPFLSLAPNGGIPIPVKLRKAGERVYTGSFEITDSTKSGTAYAVFSARDKVGNRGTEIENGATIIIDTDGPAVELLNITPADPIRNDEQNPQQVFVSFTLNDQLKNGTEPQLGYKIADSEVSFVGNLVQVSEFGWKGSLQLPPQAGLSEPQSIVFMFSASDDLDNISHKILGKNSWQVYQGDLPPLDIPSAFKGASLPSGQIQLNWSPIDGASGYEIYRQTPRESDLSLLLTVNPADAYIDTTVIEDGDYLYAISSVREDNGERAISALSESIVVNSDSIAPSAPMNLALTLESDGIRADWTSSSVEKGISYRLYRSADDNITDVSGLTPVMTGIYGMQALDHTPEENQHAYVVTAVDLAGNESTPSNSAYLNFQLLPISELDVSLSEGEQPVVHWAHGGAIVQSYDIYLGGNTTGSPLNDSSITTNEYKDTGYSNNSRVYTVVAKDAANAESLGRSIALPLIELDKTTRKTIKRGVMNILSYSLKNAGAESLENAILKVVINGREHQSTVFDLATGETSNVDVVVGGYSDLADSEEISLNLISIPSPGKKIDLQFKDTINTIEAGLLLNIKTQNLNQGGTGQLSFTLQNSSAVALDIITASNTGKEPSNDVRIKLTDLDGNVLQVIPYLQAVGSTVTTLADGTSISRIAANSIFESDWFDLDLAVTTPEWINIILEIDHIHYALGTKQSVTIKGLKTSREATTNASPYSASITAINPQASYGDQNINIEGQVLSADSNRALPDAVVTLVIEVAGFEREAIVRTDNLGKFKYQFEPNEGESGLYTVSAIHPSRTDRPQSGSFVINHVSATPYDISLKMPRNYEQLIPIKITAGDGTTSTQTRLRVEPVDQSGGGEPPVGFIIDASKSVNLSSGQTGTLELKVTANAQAQDTGTIRLALTSDESGADPLQYITINYELSDAVPALFFSPNYVETGLGRNESVTELIELENRGLAVMSNVTLELIDQAGGLAPEWAYLVSPANQGDLAIGEKRNIQLIASLGTNIPEGIYQLALRVTSDNHETQDIGVYVSVTQSGEGSFILKAEDIYTATINEEGQLIQGVDNTRFRIQNESVASIEFTQSTDESGEVFFQNIPAGRYRFRATAAKHKEYVGRFTVKPGITGSQSVFLDYELITVEWSVSEITLQDKYEIVLNATFETDVPAAVVVAKPLSVTIPDMAVGDVFYGEFELLNHGLVRADDFFFKLPPDDTYFRYEAMRAIPESIPAKGRVSIPYRIIALKSFNAGANDTGAGCGGYGTGGGYGYSYECANGSTSSGGGSTGFNKSGDGGSCGLGGGTGGAGFGGGGPSGGGTESSSPAYSGIGGGDAGCKPDCTSCTCQGSGGGGGY